MVIEVLNKVKLNKCSTFHTERGSEFVNFDIGNILKLNNITRSLSALGCP